MRAVFPDVVEAGRTCMRLPTKPGDRLGDFLLRHPITHHRLIVIASDGTGWAELGFPLPVWEHVSVSMPNETPSWEEMCWVKDLFWEPEECVIQFHPPRSSYVNQHQHALHLWKPVGVEAPMPPLGAV